MHSTGVERVKSLTSEVSQPKLARTSQQRTSHQRRPNTVCLWDLIVFCSILLHFIEGFRGFSSAAWRNCDAVASVRNRRLGHMQKAAGKHKVLPEKGRPTCIGVRLACAGKFLSFVVLCRGKVIAGLMRCRPCTRSTPQDLPTVSISECPIAWPYQDSLPIPIVEELRQRESSPRPRQRIVHRAVQCLAGTQLSPSL